jgi:hypothetical protein
MTSAVILNPPSPGATEIAPVAPRDYGDHAASPSP